MSCRLQELLIEQWGKKLSKQTIHIQYRLCCVGYPLAYT